MVQFNCNIISLIQIAAPTARTIFFNRDRFVWNDWSSTSLTTFTLLNSDMLTVDCFQAASKTKGKRKRFLSYNGFFKVAKNCIELNCLIYRLIYCLIYFMWPKNIGKNYDRPDPPVEPLRTSIIQHACDICHVGMLRTGTSEANVPPALQSDR